MRCTAAASLLLLALCPIVPSQSAPSDDLWFSGFNMTRTDRFGSRIGFPGTPPISTRFRRSPTGEVWTLSGTPLDQLTLLNSVGTQTGTWTLGASAADFVSDSAGNAWVSLANSTVEGRDRSGNVVANFTIPGPGRAMALDETGRSWVGIQNQPGALLSWFALTGPPVSTVGLPGSIGQVVDIAVDGRPGGSHAWVIGDASREVLEVDRQGTVVATVLLPSPSAAGLSQLAVAPDRRVWIAASDGLWSIDPASLAVRQMSFRDTTAITFDAKGGLWVLRSGGLTKLDVAAGRPQFSLSLGIGYDCDDAAGLTLAQFVDRTGDFDGDGFANGAEVDAGTNPFDPLSSARLDFGTARLESVPGEDVEFVARGDLGWGFVLFGVPPIGLPVAIPGIDGVLLLQNASSVTLSMPVPGRASLRVPPVSAAGSVALQLLRMPVGAAAPRLSEFAIQRLAPARTSTFGESFANESHLDRERSSGSWQGVARPGPLGGVGRLGSFDYRVGVEVSPGVFEFRTDGQVFPASVTLFGRPVTVTDGVFDFTDFVVPAGITVRFVGSRPAVVRVRGNARIDGVVDVSGADVPGDFDARAPTLPVGSTPIGVPGQPGSAGGAGAGSGGGGGDGCPGLGGVTVDFHGEPGEDLVAPPLSGYAGAVAGTGGRGGPLWPTAGSRSSVVYNLFFSITGQVGSGGGGGGYLGAGGPGRALQSFTGVPSDLAPPTAGGGAMPFVAQPAGASALDHFLLGGSGGGGGGSHPLNMGTTAVNGTPTQAPTGWHAGAGGAGGGGALGLSVGHVLVVGAQGSLASRGGGAAEYLSSVTGPPAPGGGGSGGSVVLQVGGPVNQGGTIDLSGGAGGHLNHRQFNNSIVDSVGGDGAPGYVRLETPGGASTGQLGTVLGPVLGSVHVGTLVDVDAFAGQVSQWYPVAAFRPVWKYYRLRVLVNGVAVDYSDDPVAFRPAVGPGVPVQLFLQAAPIDASRQLVGAPGPWRSYAADLNLDPGSGYRFMLLFDRSVARDVAVDDLQIDLRS